MYTQDLQGMANKLLGEDFSNSPISPEQLPETPEELEVMMQTSYKQSVEIAEEEAINMIILKQEVFMI